MKTKSIISILGAGALGTALAVLITNFGKGKVKLWDRNPDTIEAIGKIGKNLKYLGEELKVPQEIELLTDLTEAIKDSNLLLLAVPSFAVRDVCQKISKYRLPPILTTSKGMEKETSLLPSEIAKDILGKDKDILHLSWVGFAREVRQSTVPATAVLTSENQNLLREIEEVFDFQDKEFSLSTSADLLGNQLAGALKNVIAIGIGITEGNKENSEIKNSLINEGVREMTLLGKMMGAEEGTFLGPAGKKDLEISSTPRSRNYSYGQAIVKKGIAQVFKDLSEKGTTVEGFHTAWAAQKLAEKYGLKLPLIEKTYRAIYTS